MRLQAILQETAASSVMRRTRLPCIQVSQQSARLDGSPSFLAAALPAAGEKQEDRGQAEPAAGSDSEGDGSYGCFVLWLIMDG